MSQNQQRQLLVSKTWLLLQVGQTKLSFQFRLCDFYRIERDWRHWDY